jgi:hypothetical protein
MFGGIEVASLGIGGEIPGMEWCPPPGGGIPFGRIGICGLEAGINTSEAGLLVGGGGWLAYGFGIAGARRSINAIRGSDASSLPVKAISSRMLPLLKGPMPRTVQLLLLERARVSPPGDNACLVFAS